MHFVVAANGDVMAAEKDQSHGAKEGRLGGEIVMDPLRLGLHCLVLLLHVV